MAVMESDQPVPMKQSRGLAEDWGTTQRWLQRWLFVMLAHADEAHTYFQHLATDHH